MAEALHPPGAAAAGATLAGRPLREGMLLALGAAALVLLLAVCVGDPTPGNRSLLIVLLGVPLGIGALARPDLGFLGLASSSVFLLAIAAFDGRSLTSLDVLFPPVLIATYLGTAAGQARARAARRRGAAQEAIAGAGRRLTRATVVFYALAVLSLASTVWLGHVRGAAESAISLARAFEGLLLFPLAMIWLRDERDLRRMLGVLVATLPVMTIVNAFAVAGGGVKRAGITWYVNEFPLSVADPNEAGTAMVMLWAIILALRSEKPTRRSLLGLGLVLVMLVLAQTRSGLLAWGTFGLLTIRRARWRQVVLGVLCLALLIPFVPDEYWGRMWRTLVYERGSFEAYTTYIRLFGWQAAVQMFLDHPLVGVGYLGYRHFAPQYNQFGLMFDSTESYYLEVATGMGVVGLVALAILLRRLLAIGGTVRKAVAPGTLAWHLAGNHTPLIAGLLVANLTGSNFVGMLGLGQLALWCALVLRAGQVAAAGAEVPPEPRA